MNTILKKTIRAAVLMFALALICQGVRANMAYAAVSDAGETLAVRNADWDNSDLGSVHKEYVVAKDGSGDFQTIQEAVDNARDGDTIRIFPGVYYENVLVKGKELNLIGTDKDKCMIQYDNASYLCVPLEIAAGKVSNLTIYGIHIHDNGLLPEETEWVIERYGEEVARKYLEIYKGFPGYAVHADQNSSYGKELRFENCRIISENGACVGMGSRGGEKIVFEKCELLSRGIQSCIFLHDSILYEYGGETYFSLQDCQLRSNNGVGILRIDQLLDCNNYILNFQNVEIYVPSYMPAEQVLLTGNFSENIAAGWHGLNNTMLTPGSSGNTLDVMNWDINTLSDYERTQLSLFGELRLRSGADSNSGKLSGNQSISAAK